MFYEGDLQSGIATALRESKQVVCFVKGKYHAYEENKFN